MDNELTMEVTIQTLLELLEAKKYSRARDEILKNNTVIIAEILEEIIENLGIEKAVILFRTFPKDVSVEVFAYLPIDDQIEIISVITDKEIQHIIDELAFDDMIDVLEELPANVLVKFSQGLQENASLLIHF